MSLDPNTVIMLLGFVTLFLAIMKNSNRMENRITRVETILRIMQRGKHVSARAADELDCETDES